MIDFISITNDPEKAKLAFQSGVKRIMVDLEIIGKAGRQPKGSLISHHQMQDVSVIRKAVPQAELMVRVNPFHDGTEAEVSQAIANGADLIMLPMVMDAKQMAAVKSMCADRVKLVPLIEHRTAMQNLDAILGAGADEAYLGLNDLHLSLKQNFMFEPLADGLVDKFAQTAKRHHLSYGFGGIGALGSGALSADAIIKEHARLGSSRVILSRTLDNAVQESGADYNVGFADAVAALKSAYNQSFTRSSGEVQADQEETTGIIRNIATEIKQRRGVENPLRG